MSKSLKNSSLLDLLLWLLGLRSRFRVTGNSMLPLLQPGEEILIHPRAYRHQCPLPGDLVVVSHPSRPELRLVKRVVQVKEDGDCFLMGENTSESTDSRSFGWVSSDHLLGKVISRFP